MRPYKHYDDTDLFLLADQLDAEVEKPGQSQAFLQKQLALVEDEIAQREYELEAD